MGADIIVLILPMLVFLLPTAFIRIKSKSRLSTDHQGPITTTEALNQLTLHFIIYFVLLLVPVGGRLAGAWGQPIALGILFIIIVSLLVRFKKLGDE
ncbi:MAG: hypothetical protein K2P81_03985 [Bacteriovoracaceae bacterium]|nr:hypothetical protein [Bacteriovoracaceae bacterium]